MRRLLAVIGILLFASTAWSQTGRRGYYQFPALHGDTLVFAAEGDLWKVSTDGGVAQRLTSHAAQESDPVISPDGTTVAFTARYEGPAEMYTMPISGGVPTRQTYETATSTPITWNADGDLVYSTTHYSTLPQIQLVQLDLATGTRRPVPLSQASEGSYDDRGRTLFFVRPAFHRNVTKRYQGGTARKIWKYTNGEEEATPLTADYAGESHTPMWWDGRVYFVSPRDGTMNLWSMDEDGGDLRQHTDHSGWDAKHAALQGGRIIYQVGADLWIYDIGAENTQLVPITLASDFDQLREKWVTDPLEYLTSAHIHPEGESVVLTARGRVFVAPVGAGRLVQASRQEGVRYRDVVFMPDGDKLLGLTDQTVELEFATLPANGVGTPELVTDNGDVLRFEGTPSPDGEWIAFTDNNADLTVVETATGTQRVISTNQEGAFNIAWSPDSSRLVFAQRALNSYAQLWLYDIASDSEVALTSDRVNSVSPSWSADGDWLYFLSDRNLRTIVGSPWGARQPEPYFDRPMKIYHVSMRQGLRSPFKPADELFRKTEESEAEESAESAPMHVDLDGIQRRVKAVPVSPGNYRSLSVSDKAVFWLSRGTGSGARTGLMALAIGNEDPSPATVVEGVGSYELSRDGSSLLVRRGSDLYVVKARASKISDLEEHKLDLSGWSFSIDVAEDWRQIFIDAWRLERDYFYDPGMHGVAWDVVLEKYLQLVERITTREELSDLIGRVVGELSALHTSVRGGDLREGVDQVQVASLGARLFRDPGAGGYRIDYIYRNDPDYPDAMSPLADPDLEMYAGDVIEAVNGVETLAVPHIGSLLRNQQGRQVLLTVRRDGGAPRDVVVVPIGRESDLRYSDWEYTRRLRVEEAGESKIGYVHLRAMGSGDLNAWYRQFYPVHDRQGLIIDVRSNRGGNVDSIILEKLMRQAWMYWKSRVGRPTWNMQYAFRGHMIVLVNENTASDGEAFAEGFRRLGLGPVMGTRTWGGEIWLSSVNRLSDGGLARAPMNGVYGNESEWLIEGWGVEPDIVVDNPPHATFRGQDAQLDAAVAKLLEQIATDPRAIPTPPAYPDKEFRYPDRVGSGSGQR